MASALRSFSRRKISPKWFCKTSFTSPIVLQHDKDYNNKPTFSDSSLLARSFHRHISSSSSSKQEESSIKIEALGDAVLDGSVESVQAMVDVRCSYGFSGEWTHVASQNVQRQVRELKNLGMSIQKVRRVMQTCDPKDMAENKLLEIELTAKFRKRGLSYLPICFLDLLIPMACIQAINNMCIVDSVFENGAGDLPLVKALTFWFTSKVPTTSLTTILSRMKELPLYCIFFLVLQATFDLYYPAVYFFLITYKISLYTLMCRSKQIAEFRKALGVRYVPVTASDQERIMASVINVMREFIDVEKDKK